jgi:hypothetical protein
MQHLPIADVAQRLVREVVCPQCYQRPLGSEALGPEVARPCEGSCPLFYHLPTLVRLAGRIGDEPGGCEAAVKQSVCAGCRLRPTAGDFCADYVFRTCPLSRHSGDVLQALARVLHATPDDDTEGVHAPATALPVSS